MGCSLHTDLANAPRPTVTVNGVVIPHEAIAFETQNHPARSPVAAWQAAARSLVVRELLLQEADRLGIAAAPECDDEGRSETPEEAMIRELIARTIVTPEPTDADCRRYYDRNRDKFRAPTIYEVAHILLSASRHDRASFETKRREAEALIATLSREPERFAAIAQAHSACPSSVEGGRLGQIVAGQTTPEFESALMRLAPGEMTRAPVETRYGFHIIRLDRCIAGEEVPFELAKGPIAEYLRAAAINQARALYVQMLVGHARIDGIQLDPGQHRREKEARLS